MSEFTSGEAFLFQINLPLLKYFVDKNMRDDLNIWCKHLHIRLKEYKYFHSKI